MLKAKKINKGDIRRTTAISKILGSKKKNIKKSMVEAGFSVNYADNPSQFMNTKKVKKELDWLKYEQEQIRDRMEKTRNKAKYKELGDTYQGLSKITQLVGGNPTERIIISSKDKEAIDKAFLDNQ